MQHINAWTCGAAITRATMTPFAKLPWWISIWIVMLHCKPFITKAEQALNQHGTLARLLLSSAHHIFFPQWIFRGRALAWGHIWLLLGRIMMNMWGAINLGQVCCEAACVRPLSRYISPGARWWPDSTRSAGKVRVHHGPLISDRVTIGHTCIQSSKTISAFNLKRPCIMIMTLLVITL